MSSVVFGKATINRFYIAKHIVPGDSVEIWHDDKRQWAIVQLYDTQHGMMTARLKFGEKVITFPDNCIYEFIKAEPEKV